MNRYYKIAAMFLAITLGAAFLSCSRNEPTKTTEKQSINSSSQEGTKAGTTTPVEQRQDSAEEDD